MQTEKTCVIGSTLAEVKCLIDEVVVSNTKLPMLLESGYKDFNIMALRGKFYGIAQSIGDCDLAELSGETLDAMQTEKTCVIGSSMTETKPRSSRDIEATRRCESNRVDLRPFIMDERQLFQAKRLV